MNLNLIVENLDLVANFIAGWLPFLLGYLALGVLGGPVLQLDVYFLERELARAERMLGVASTLPRNYTLARQGDIDRITEVRALLRASIAQERATWSNVTLYKGLLAGAVLVPLLFVMVYSDVRQGRRARGILAEFEQLGAMAEKEIP